MLALFSLDCHSEVDLSGKKLQRTPSWCQWVGAVLRQKRERGYQKTRPKSFVCSFSYSALASFRMGMSGSASFERAEKSWYAVRAFGGVAGEGVGAGELMRRAGGLR